MDVGALLCRPRDPRCSECPLRRRCATRGPLAEETRARQAPFAGSFRQRRGTVMARLRERPGPRRRARSRGLASLVGDGLAVVSTGTRPSPLTRRVSLSRPPVRPGPRRGSSPTANARTRSGSIPGWNCTPSIGSSRWRRPMTRPSSDSAVTSSTSGTVSRATTSEWYRVATNGSGRPRNTPRPSWVICEVFPCITCGALTTSPPKI